MVSFASGIQAQLVVVSCMSSLNELTLVIEDGLCASGGSTRACASRKSSIHIDINLV